MTTTTLPATRQSIPALVQAAVEARDVILSDRAADAIADTVGHGLRLGYAPGYTATWYESAGPIDPTAAEAARAALAPLLQPAGSRFVVAQLARLRTMVRPPRDQSSEDFESAVSFMSAELAGFPPDVVERACRDHARECQFWPSLAEIFERCQALVQRRRSLETCLRIGEQKHALDTRPSPVGWAQWCQRLLIYRDRQIWREDWGPRPGEAGCRAPAPLVDLGRLGAGWPGSSMAI